MPESSLEEVAERLIVGEFPADYDAIISSISDEDLERLWATYMRKRQLRRQDPAQL